MIEGLAVLVLVPAVLGYVFGRLGPDGDAQGCALAFAAALVPALFVVIATGSADAITAAASVAVMPVLFGLMCLPAMAGVGLARNRRVGR